MRQPARTTIITLWGALITALALALSITAPAVAIDPGGAAHPTTTQIQRAKRRHHRLE